MTIADLYLYPVKSLGGIRVTEAVVEERGFRHDRRFMLVDPAGQFMTQRTNAQMALIDVAIAGETLRLWHRHQPADVLTVPLEPKITTFQRSVSVWDSHNLPANVVSADADTWFSRVLGQPCHLVYMPDTTHRYVDTAYADPDDVVSFADGYPYLLISEASLVGLNARLAQPVDMLRFRPNIVVSNVAAPHDEDWWARFRIGNVAFRGVKPCARCVVTTIDPATGEKGREPLRTLTTYRKTGNRILFGQNVLTELPVAPNAVVRVGDTVAVFRRAEPPFLPERRL